MSFFGGSIDYLVGYGKYYIKIIIIKIMENSSRVVRAYLAYYGISGMMGLAGLITICCKLLGAHPKSFLLSK